MRPLPQQPPAAPLPPMPDDRVPLTDRLMAALLPLPEGAARPPPPPPGEFTPGGFTPEQSERRLRRALTQLGLLRGDETAEVCHRRAAPAPHRHATLLWNTSPAS